MKCNRVSHLVPVAVFVAGGLVACGRSKPIAGATASDVDDAGAAAQPDADVLAAVGLDDGGLGDGPLADAPAQLVLPASCASDTDVPPKSLVCTGLYADILGKVVAPGVVSYAPAIPLWSDGAQKQRWIGLPPGGIIDNTNPNEWVFPVGTKVWKEFSRGGQRVETRIWQKVRTGYWVDATYTWNADESAGTVSGGGDIVLNDGSAYHVPTQDECEKCHRGRNEHILGFEQVLLGLPGATGLTLEALVEQGKLTVPPASTSLTLGDDGTGAAAPALGWLHVNCGTTCHNDNSNSTAYAAGMLMRLDPALLDGRAVDSTFDPVRTTIGVIVGTPNWSGQIRIVPGSTDRSLIYQLISHRGMGVQMPPIATNVVDEVDDALVATWISRMPPAASPTPDAGAADGPASTPDAEAGTPGLIDASTDSPAGTGGVSGTGGAGTGGVSGTGGAGTGGVPGTGGAGTGGVPGTGGTGTGGVSGTGGVDLGTGGASASGGVSGTGGADLGTGGAAASGGVSGTGGGGTGGGAVVSTGGAGTGGVSGTGGVDLGTGGASASGAVSGTTDGGSTTDGGTTGGVTGGSGGLSGGDLEGVDGSADGTGGADGGG
jgi:hypothetical protein